MCHSQHNVYEFFCFVLIKITRMTKQYGYKYNNTAETANVMLADIV